VWDCDNFHGPKKHVQRKSRTKRFPADLFSENFGIDDAMVVLENGVPDTYPQVLRRLYADQLEMLAAGGIHFIYF